MALVADVSWREQYVSHALNRKFTGVIPTGVYQGFACTVASDGTVTVGQGETPNTAVAEVGGYSVTIRMDEPATVATTAATPYVVLSPYYAIGAPTRVDIKAVSTPESHHIVLCRVTPAADTPSGEPEIDDAERDAPLWHQGSGIDAETLAQMAAAQVETMEQQMALHERVYALEQTAG